MLLLLAGRVVAAERPPPHVITYLRTEPEMPGRKSDWGMSESHSLILVLQLETLLTVVAVTGGTEGGVLGRALAGAA